MFTWGKIILYTLKLTVWFNSKRKEITNLTHLLYHSKHSLLRIQKDKKASQNRDAFFIIFKCIKHHFPMKSKSLLYISIALLLYWLSTKIINIYNYPILGAIYEITALFALLTTYILPIFVLIFLFRSQPHNRKNYLAPLLLSIATILVLFLVPFFLHFNSFILNQLKPNFAF